MTFDSQECVWSDIKVTVLGGRMTKLRSIKYSRETESELLYAEGNQPRGIQDGNEKYDGSLKILRNDLIALNTAARAAGFSDITKIPYQVNTITVNYKEAFGRPNLTDILYGVKFTKYEKSMEQGAKMQEVELPFLFLDLDDDN